jgi:hypothetical protein
MNAQVNIQLSADEALVLFEYFARFAENDEWCLRHNAEFCAFSRIAGVLESTLVAPFRPDYSDQLERARERVAGGFEGIAPSVVPSASSAGTKRYP